MACGLCLVIHLNLTVNPSKLSRFLHVQLCITEFQAWLQGSDLRSAISDCPAFEHADLVQSSSSGERSICCKLSWGKHSRLCTRFDCSRLFQNQEGSQQYHSLGAFRRAKLQRQREQENLCGDQHCPVFLLPAAMPVFLAFTNWHFSDKRKIVSCVCRPLFLRHCSCD